MLHFKLPAETLWLIIQHTNDYPTLAAIALTNRFLGGEATRLLYRTVGYDHSSEYMCAPQETIINKPSLAIHVQRYLVREQSCSELPKWHLQPLRPGETLSKMVNLKWLYLSLTRAIPADILDGAPCQLETLVCEAGNIFSKSLTPRFTFLVKQTRLLRVNLKEIFGTNYGCRPMPLPYCMSLEHVAGDHHLMQALMPGRKVFNLIWNTSNEDEGADIIVSLRKEFGLLKVLAFVPPGDWAPSLRLQCMAMKHLRDIQYLQLSIDPPNSDEVLRGLYELSTLVGLVLQPGTRSTFYADMERERFRILFSRCSRLQFADIEVDRDAEEGKGLFKRWVRTASGDKGKCLRSYFARRDIVENIYGSGSNEASFL